MNLDKPPDGRGKLDAFGGNFDAAMEGQREISGVQTAQGAGFARGSSINSAMANGTNQAAAIQGTLAYLGEDGSKAHTMAALQTQKNIGQTMGEKDAHSIAQSYGFQGDYTKFNSFVSQMGSLKNFGDAQGMKKVADKFFNGDLVGMTSFLVDNNAYQTSKHKGETR